MWLSGALTAHLSCFEIGLDRVAFSSARSALLNAGKPANPSFFAVLSTVGVETPADRASEVMLTRPATG